MSTCTYTYTEIDTLVSQLRSVDVCSPSDLWHSAPLLAQAADTIATLHVKLNRVRADVLYAYESGEFVGPLARALAELDNEVEGPGKLSLRSESGG